MSNKQNLIINGSGSYSGGNYDKIVIRGEGTIVNNIECLVFKTFGTSEALENVKADIMKVMGEAEIKGNIEAGEVVIMGTMSIDGKAPINSLKVRGMLEVGESLSGKNADIKGSISVGGDVEYEAFNSTGSFEIKGLLNAETIKIRLHHCQSTVEEIGGSKISVKRRKSSILPFFKDNSSLAAKVIEGDDIYLENTEAEIVRGNSVKIGPGCTIGLVEYAKEFSKDKDSTVKKETKSI
jgi:cytoskeletal protein CcmA (bactofilin family)